MNEIEFLGAFSSWKLDDHTWAITFCGGSQYLYLIEGEDKALLIDTGFGFGTLRAYVESLTDKPIVVANTHTHHDHAGGNGWWDSILMHKNGKLDLRGINDGPFDVSTLPHPDYAHVYIGESDIIDLGGIEIEVFEAGAHSVSGLLFFERAMGRLFSGDELESAQVMLISYFDDEHTLLQRATRHAEIMRRLLDMGDELKQICPAHNGAPISKEYIGEYLELDELILAGKHIICDCLGHFYVEMRPDAESLRRTRHKKASFIYRAEGVKWT